MWKRKVLFAAMVASTLSAFPLVASAERVVIETAPPPAREEVVPAPRHGYVWAPGYWEWRHGHHVWVKGHWERERHGMYWHPSRWVQRDGKYEFEKGRWDRERFAENATPRDRDGDGVPNRLDRAPDNPYRR